MTEENFDPIKEFTNIRDTLSKAVERGLKKTIEGPLVLVDVYETEDEVIVRTCPIDGATSDSLEVSVENGVLSIQGETKPEEEKSALKYHTRERVFGTFSREINIPVPVKANEAKAKFKAGVLTIHIPKIVDNRPQVIDITPTE